jgi:hypothetical protein
MEFVYISNMLEMQILLPVFLIITSVNKAISKQMNTLMKSSAPVRLQ